MLKLRKRYHKLEYLENMHGLQGEFSNNNYRPAAF